MFKETLRNKIVPAVVIVGGLVAFGGILYAYDATAPQVRPVDCGKDPKQSGSISRFVGTDNQDFLLIAGQLIEAPQPGVIMIDNDNKTRGSDRPKSVSLVPNKGLVFQDRSRTTYTISGKPTIQNGVVGTEVTVNAQCNPQK